MSLGYWDRRYARETTPWGEQPAAQAAWVADLFVARGARRVLDLGCGTGRNTIFFARQGLVAIGVDFSRRALETARDLATRTGVACSFVIASATDLPFVDRSFDAVFSSAMFNYLIGETAQLAADEVLRVLVPGGTAVVTVFSVDDASCGLGERVGPHTYAARDLVCRYFTPGDLGQLFAQAVAEEMKENMSIDRTHDQPHLHVSLTLVARKPGQDARP